MGRSEILRALAMVAVIGVFMAALAAINRRPAELGAPDVPVASAHHGLASELRRCSALGPQDAEDAHCRAVWEEARRRFLGTPARPLPPPTGPESAAPAPSSPSSDAPAASTSSPEGR